jgi:hypothetical protein
VNLTHLYFVNKVNFRIGFSKLIIIKGNRVIEMAAFRYYLMKGEMDSFIRCSLKKWAAKQEAPEDGFIRLLQQVCLILFAKANQRQLSANDTSRGKGKISNK